MTTVAPRGGPWDVVIVGTGMGGATLGYILARAGRKVLFCEKGRSYLNDPGARCGNYAEVFKGHRGVPTPADRDAMAAAGRWWDEIHDVSQGRTRRFIPYIGSGTGGSSALYGAALERFFPADFTPARNFPGDHGAELPEAWPVSFEELLPYYREAEALYRVQGGPDPLKTGGEAGQYRAEGEALEPPNRELMSFFAAKGLNPYRLPVGCEQISGCSGCQGYLCGNSCKNDSARICLATAISEYGATLWDNCDIVGLDADHSRVQRARAVHNGQPVSIEAETFVLAAGALATPHLLLRSKSDWWPEGLANGSGLVGRMMMRHFVDLYAVFTKDAGLGKGAKQVALNDLYLSSAGKFGTVQSFGALPPPAVLVDSVRDDVEHALFKAAGLAIEAARPLMEPFLRTLFGRATMLASITEDLPYRDNRVFVGEGGEVCIDYRVRPYERKRIAAVRAEVAAILKPYRMLLIKQAENNQRIAHVCGTCRAGDDPASSVLNRNNRAHQVDNLYVADASFFPSSGGTNPALTIAASALRMADQMIGINREQIA